MKKEESVVYNEKPKRTNKVLVAIIIIVASIFTILPIVGMVYAFLEFDNYVYTDFEETGNGEIVVKKDVSISDVNGLYNEEDETYYIQGYLENTSDDDITSIYIEYLVYDSNDVLLGTAFCGVDNLGSNTKWKFKAIYSDIDSNEVSRFELSQVEIY